MPEEIVPPTPVPCLSPDRLHRRGEGGTGTIQQRSSSSLFYRRPLWAVLAWARMSTLWCCPSSISSADHGVARLSTSPEGWFWRGCRGVWHVRTMQCSAFWQLAVRVPEDPQGSWSRFAPHRWPCAPTRRCGEVSSGTWFLKLESFFQSQQAGSIFHSQRGGWRWQETCRTWTC